MGHDACIASIAQPCPWSCQQSTFSSSSLLKKKYIYLNSFIEIQFVYCTSHSFEVYNSMAVIVGASEL